MSLIFPASSAPLKNVDHIQFSMLSPEEIKAHSVAKIDHAQTVDEQNQPKEGGLLDPRMGPMDKHLRCLTCDENYTDCPGHFGHIELAKPIFNYGSRL